MNDLSIRLFEFSAETIKFSRKLPESTGYKVTGIN